MLSLAAKARQGQVDGMHLPVRHQPDNKVAPINLFLDMVVINTEN